MKLISRLLLYIFHELCSLIGGALVIIGILFPFNASGIVNVRNGETFTRDIFGLPIPEPPLWVSNIPLLAGPLSFISKFFSLHGLAVLGVASILWVTGITIYSKGSKNATQQKEAKKLTKDSSDRLIMTSEELNKVADQIGEAMVKNLQYHTTHDDENLSETPAKTLPERARAKYTEAFLKAGISHLLVIKDRPGMVTQIINPPYPRPPLERMTKEELEKTADQVGQAMVKNLQYHTTHDEIKNDRDVANSGDTTELAANDQKPPQNHTKRLVSLISTEGKTKEQIKLEAKRTYQKFLQSSQQKPQESPQPQSSEDGMTDKEFQDLADQLGQAMVKNLQHNTTHDDMNTASIEEKLAKLDKEYPFVPSTNAGRLFSMVRRMKAEKEMGIPINYRSSRIISVNLPLKESKKANEMSEQEWESFYKNLSEQLEMGYPELYRKAVG